MTTAKKRWLIGAGVFVAAAGAAGYFAISRLQRRFEPYIREQAISYLQKRFASEVELADLRVRLPRTSPWRLLVRRGRGAMARVEGRGVRLRQGGRRDVPPLFEMDRFAFDVDLGALLDRPMTVPRVVLDGVRIHVPPAGRRANPAVRGEPPGEPAKPETPPATGVLIQEVLLNQAALVILPKDPSKRPLHFDIHRLRLESVGAAEAMRYDAELTNPKPPGSIRSRGTFGPWVAGDPGRSPLGGDYIFEKADLGVFPSIAGILTSTGSFQGTLESIEARGQAWVPDFRLKQAGNPVPLHTSFEVRVDGTNGNTILKPVRASLGDTRFTTSGGVIRHEGERRRSIELDVDMPAGHLRDLLRLAVKGAPFMRGRIRLAARIGIPPLEGKVREKLLLDGRFSVTEGVFLRSTIQEQIDNLSRRGQGKPGSREIDEVVSSMAGRFQLENEVLTFRSLSFGVPGAWVDLAGRYNLDGDGLDLRGALRLQARVSQTQTGWKRWALKPVDPFFAKNGAGTFLRIRVDGTSREPKFGLDRGRRDDAAPAGRADRAQPALPVQP